jgi:acetyl esterase/lipase
VVRVEPSDVLSRAAELPDAVVRYGAHDDALVDVHLPAPELGSSPPRRPLVVLLHGGFWRSRFDQTHTRPMAEALVAAGFVVATPEYRRVGGAGALAGGWPTTFEDVTAAMTALPGLLQGLGVETATTTVVGHSAGGHLALLLAATGQRLDRVVAIAPVCDLRAAAQERLSDGAVQDFLGGEPQEVPQAYAAADPMTRLTGRPGCELLVVHGSDDDVVPVEHSRGLAARHPEIRLVELPGADHYAPIDPLSDAWPEVLAAVRGEQVAVP